MKTVHTVVLNEGTAVVDTDVKKGLAEIGIRIRTPGHALFLDLDVRTAMNLYSVLGGEIDKKAKDFKTY